MTQRQLLLHIMHLVIKSGVCPNTPITSWPKLLLFAHTRGFLWVSPDLKTIVCGYRSNSPVHSDTMPNEEGGSHLHIAWTCSESSDRTSLLKMLRSYLRENKDVEDISYFRRNSPTDFKQLTLKGHTT